MTSTRGRRQNDGGGPKIPRTYYYDVALWKKIRRHAARDHATITKKIHELLRIGLEHDGPAAK